MKRPPNAPLFLHLTADCPCCRGEMTVLYRSVGHLSVAEASHRGAKIAVEVAP